MVARHRPSHPNCDFTQPGNLFRKVMTDREREHTISNVFRHISGVPRDIQERAVKNFFKADPEYGNGIGRLLGFSAIKPRIWSISSFLFAKELFIETLNEII